jgi:hypothetical protein
MLNSDSLIKLDTTALKMFHRYKKIEHHSFDLKSVEEIRSILQYIQIESKKRSPKDSSLKPMTTNTVDPI